MRFVTCLTFALAVTTIVGSVGCAFLLIFAVALGSVFLRLLRQFFWRAAALENLGVRDAFRRGWELFKGNWQSGALMWLVMLGLAIAYGLAMILVVILLKRPKGIMGMARQVSRF